MALSLIPQIHIEKYEDVTAENLLSRGISLLLCDLDFTLAPKVQKDPDQHLKKWIRSLEKEGITVMILSNNRSPKRVKRFCLSLQIPFMGRARKPSPWGIYDAMVKYSKTKEQVAVLGDKLLTDTLAGNLAGVTVIMVEPRGGAVTWWQKVLHFLQAPFKKKAKETAL